MDIYSQVTSASTRKALSKLGSRLDLGRGKAAFQLQGSAIWLIIGVDMHKRLHVGSVVKPAKNHRVCGTGRSRVNQLRLRDVQRRPRAS